MLEYNRIDISEGIDVNKTSASEEGNICHYWYFKDIVFKYEPYLCIAMVSTISDILQLKKMMIVKIFTA